jgi:hypothetical protein
MGMGAGPEVQEVGRYLAEKPFQTGALLGSVPARSDWGRGFCTPKVKNPPPSRPRRRPPGPGRGEAPPSQYAGDTDDTPQGPVLADTINFLTFLGIVV